MTTRTLTAAIWLPGPRDEVFAFFADAGNLELITPEYLRFQIRTPQPIAMTEGTLIDYSLRLNHFPIRWRTRIAAWEPPYRFVDEQLRGPYRRWVHEHTFESVDGGTLCRDRVDYAVPGGRWVDRCFVRSRVVDIFTFRQRKLGELLGKDGWRELASPRVTASA
ncbi:MAG: SRPBCC family protein [Phycisphaeraceae bacterium]|nr:SRPBCC family protein [Phycisphaeraceae bacterium]